MKTNKPRTQNKPLSLRKQTLRRLDEGKLTEAAGGTSLIVSIGVSIYLTMKE